MVSRNDLTKTQIINKLLVLVPSYKKEVGKLYSLKVTKLKKILEIIQKKLEKTKVNP
jgi:hypothetical protein